MRIREIRRSRNITQKELAEYIGVGYSVISKYESGKIIPPANRLSKMAEFFDVSIDELVVENTPSRIDQTSRLAAYLIALNRGTCELCSAPAPFEDEVGIPFLQEYYIEPLSEGGTISKNNLTVLCPNCFARISAAPDKLELILQLRRIIEERDLLW